MVHIARGDGDWHRPDRHLGCFDALSHQGSEHTADVPEDELEAFFEGREAGPCPDCSWPFDVE